MKRILFAAVSATALATGFMAATPTPVMAQMMAQQLQDSVTNGMAQLGMDTRMVGMMTLMQLQEIELTLNGTDTDEVKMGRIETVMADASMMPGGMGTMSSEGMASGGMSGMSGASGLEEIVRTDLAQLGISDEVDVNALTVGQLSEVTLVMNGTDTDDVKRGRVEQILGLN